MESCFNTRREQVEPLGVEDLKKDLSMEFSTLPYSEVRPSCLNNTKEEKNGGG